MLVVSRKWQRLDDARFGSDPSLKSGLAQDPSKPKPRLKSPSLPTGWMPVYVGKKIPREKFVIPVRFICRPEFKYLLKISEEEFGFQQEGCLTIPCDVALFLEVCSKIFDAEEAEQSKLLMRKTLTP